MGIYQDVELPKSNAARVLYAVVLMLYEQYLLATQKEDAPFEAFVRLEFQDLDSYYSLLDGITDDAFVNQHNI